MLDLLDNKWSKLKDAYGEATAVPVLLRELRDTPQTSKASRDKIWESLWSKLCHQGDIYSASYAAVPHLIEIALAFGKQKIDYNLILLPLSIELARIQKKQEIPEEFKESYLIAINKVLDCIANQFELAWDSVTTRVYCAALALLKGHAETAEKILGEAE